MATIIVLGYRPGLDRALARRGLDALYVVEKPKAALRDRRTRLVRALEDAQEVLRTVLAEAPSDVVGVVTGHEQGVFTAAALRARLGLPGDTDAARSLYFRDKYLQKSALPSRVRRAHCRYVTRGTSFDDLAETLGTPFVVKPANGFGAVATTRVASAVEFTRAVGAAGPGSDVALAAESLVEGEEIHVDGVWEGGRLRWHSVGRYHRAPMDCAGGDGVLATYLLLPREEPELFAATAAMAEAVLGPLDAPDCVFHLEAFETADGLVFGECAVRLGGGFVPEIVALTHGVDLYECQLRIALGEAAGSAAVARAPTECHGQLLLRRFPGRDLTQADFERRFPFVELDYPATSRVGAYGRTGYAIVSAPDGRTLRRLVADIAAFNEHGDTPLREQGDALHSGHGDG